MTSEPKTPREKMDAIDPAQFKREMYNEWSPPEPKTPQELNEAVAKKLGLKYHGVYATGGLLLLEYEDGKIAFNPATDPAAALWALPRFCDEKCWGYLIEREPGSKQISIEFSCGSQGHYFGRQDGFALPELICRAIVEAAE